MTKPWENRLKSAVVGIDFSDGSLQAIKLSGLLQRAGGVNVTAFHALDADGIDLLADSVDMPKADLIDDLKQTATKKIDGWIAGAGFTHPPEVKTGFGVPTKELMAEARSADLLIIGERGESHLNSGVGTLAAHCVRNHPGKVMLVETQNLKPQIETVVACLDFSPASTEVAAEAVAIARMVGAKVHFLHVYRAPWDQLHYRAPSTASQPHFKREFLEVLENKMTECVGKVAAEEDERALFRSTSYGFGIVEYARQHRADLVVLGTHGRSTFKEICLGSTAERLLRELPCSMMTVRTSKH